MLRRGRAVLGSVVVALAVACENGQAKLDREQAEQRLRSLEESLLAEVSAGSSLAEVIRFLDAHKVAHEKNPMPGELVAYLGEWHGPVFQRGLHLVFYFDKAGRLIRYEAKEVEGS